MARSLAEFAVFSACLESADFGVDRAVFQVHLARRNSDSTRIAAFLLFGRVIFVDKNGG